MAAEACDGACEAVCAGSVSGRELMQNRRVSQLAFDTSMDAGKQLKHLVPVEIYLAAGLVDGEGREQNRLLVRPKGAPVSSFRFLMQKGAESNMEVPAGWVFDEIEKKLVGMSAPIPEEKVAVPVGDPLGGKR